MIMPKLANFMLGVYGLGIKATSENAAQLTDKISIDAGSIAIRKIEENGVTKYVFRDGSSLIIAGTTLDVGIEGAQCMCAQLAGHKDNCKEANK